MDQVFQLNTHLHFGATVHISCFIDRTNHYLFSNGISYRNLISVASTDPPTEISKCLFRVIPAIKYQAETFLNSIVGQRYQNQNQKQTDEKQAKAFIDQFEFELKQNNDYSEQQNRFPIKYSESFMLQHIYSCKYLSFKKITQTNSYILELTQLPTMNSIFNLQPCYNYQKDINTYIPFNSAAFINMKISQGLDIKQLYLNFKNDSVFDCWKIEEEQKGVFEIGVFQTAHEIQYKEICYGDTVWIFHLQSGSFVKLQQKNHEVESFILGKIKYQLGYVKGQFKEAQKEDSGQLISDIFLQRTQNQTSAQKFGLWKIVYASQKGSGLNRKQHTDRFKGGKVKFDQEIRFFNIRYKRYLSVRKIKQGRNKFKFQLATQKYQEQNTTFRIKSLSPNSLYCTTQDLFVIEHVSTQTYLTLSEEFKITDTKGLLGPSSQYKKQDNFKLTKIQFIQEWQNNYILSILPFIEEGIQIFSRIGSQGLIGKKQQIMLEILLENLIQMLSFSYDLTEGFQASQNKLGKMTYNHFMVQKLLREQGVIQLVVKMLSKINEDMIEYNRSDFKKFNSMRKNYNQSQQKPFQKQKIKVKGTLKILRNFASDLTGQNKKIRVDPKILNNIINVSFKILRNCCKSNNQNSLFLFKHINTFVPFLSLGSYAQTFFVDTYVNPTILQLIGKTQFRLIIAQYIKIFSKTNEYSPQVFNLLINFVKSNQKSVSKNQVEIYQLFFQEYNPLVFPIEVIDQRFYISYQRYKYQLISFSKDFPNESQTLATQIKFFAHLTYDRNYLCSKQMKRVFPLNLIIYYLQLPVLKPSIIQGFIHILTHTYLNEKPRFKNKKHFIYSFYNIYTKEQFNHSLNVKIKRRKSQYFKNGYEYEMKEMQIRGIQQEDQRQILSFIEDVDYVGFHQLEQCKTWIKNQLKNQIQKKNDEFYSLTTQACLMCLKEMIQLNIFTTKQSEYVDQLLTSIIKKISTSLTLVNDKQVALQSNNFKQLLLEMVQKNVIKRYDHNDRFDGIQDQIGPSNICSLYVNYAFYQNILLLQKNQNQKKTSDKVIQKILELIQIYNKIVIQDKMINFLGDILQNEAQYINSVNKKQLIKKIIIDKILQTDNRTRSSTFQLLLLLFYNSNAYNINLKTISLFLKQIFTQNNFLESLQKIVFIVDQQENVMYIKMMALYQEIRLLIQTSQVWLNNDYQNPHYKYNSILLYFVDKIKKIIKITVKDYKDDIHLYGKNSNIFDTFVGLQGNIIQQQQIILNNLDLQQEILSLIENYRYMLKKITKVTEQNKLLIELFRTCFLFLYVYIYNSSENKKKLRSIILQDGTISSFFSNFGTVDLGQTKLLVQYFKDNYDECLQFYMQNSQVLQKKNTFTWIHAELIFVMLKYYNQSIVQNLKKFFISIFDFTSFKNYVWLKDGKQFMLDLNLFFQTNFQPYFYHIKMIDTLLYLSQMLIQSSNTIRSHLKKSFSQQYLYSLLQQQDYYTKQNSIKTILKVRIIFKSRIIKLIQNVYLFDAKANKNLVLFQLKKYYQMLSLWIEQAPIRQETQDFRKIIPLREIKMQKQENYDQRINQLYKSTYKNQFILQTYIASIEIFARSVLKNEALKQLHELAQGLVHKFFQLNQILHRVYKVKKNIYYPLPNEHNFKIMINPEKQSYKRKKFLLALILETSYNVDVYKKIKTNNIKLIQLLVHSLQNINLKQFFLLRKISEFLQDALQKLGNEGIFLYNTVTMIMKMLIIWMQSLSPKLAFQLRNQMGKSQLIFPILNYFQVCQLDAQNKKLFLLALQFLTELVGQDGNRFIQTIYNNYFTNKSDSLNFFMKIKQIIREISLSDRAIYQCKKVIQGMEIYKSEVKEEKSGQFVLLNFLIGLCKGNFRPNQIFLSSLGNISNFKVMNGIWEILKLQSKKHPKHLVNNENYHLITQCFNTIRQMVQGPCVQNQNEFLKREFFLTVLMYFQFEPKPEDLKLEQNLQEKLMQMNKISQSWTSQLRTYLNQDKITKDWMPSQVKYRSISLISSLLSQNINEKSLSQLATISPNLIVRQIDKVYQRYIELQQTYIQQNLDFDENQQVVLPLGFKLYEILQYFPQEKIPERTQGLKFFQQNSRVVEITHNDLCIIVFPKPTLQISEAFRKQFLQNVDRTSINSKLRDLQNVQVQNRQSDYPYGYILFFIVLCIVIMDFVIYTSIALGYVEFFNFYNIFQGYSGSFLSMQTARGIFLLLGIIFSAIFFGLQVKGAVYMKETIQNIMQSNITKFQKFKAISKLVYNNMSYLYYLILCFFLLLGIFNPFFDAIALIAQLFRRNQTFFLILQAIRDTLDQLCIMMLITCIATYILTSIIYYYYGQRKFSTQCQNMYFCLIFSLDQGFKQDPGIVGGTVDANNILTDFLNNNIFDVIINFIYLLIIKLIIGQIIGAIIVDKFAQIRQKKEKLQEDEESFCYICGIDRNTLDREEDGFEKHKEQYHNVFNYMEFLLHLEITRKSNLSGIERFVLQQKKKDKLTWFPINRSFHMQSKKKKEQTVQQEATDQTQKNMKYLDNQILQLNLQMNLMNDLVNMKMIKQKKK